MHITDIIVRKRDGGELSTEEINWFIENYTAGKVADYQAAALCMAIFFRGMTRREISDLTLAMARSGDQIDLSDVVPFALDKHSSGGVGDKTSLVVLPIVAACGVPVAKMSGRGLGHTGGTIDKLEAIHGFRAEFSKEEFKRLARENGLVLAGQSGDLAPADKLLYALRDVTGTVDSLPLIASSIMSKKLAAGADAIVLDVKTGKGAFMAKVEDARELARTMVDIGVDAGRSMVALISDMNQPLGKMAGLALEVREAIQTLQGEGPADFTEHCLVVAAHMLHLAPNSGVDTFEAAYTAAEHSLHDQSAYRRFRSMVEGQGGDVAQVDDVSRLPDASLIESVTAPQDGYLAELSALEVGLAVVRLGGGREKKGDPVDYGVGVETHHKIGDRVKAGDPLFTIYANDPAKLAEVKSRLGTVAKLSNSPVDALPLFYDTLTGRPV
ncbi:MAG: thymidine phosphorylase [Anaerolineae bacterium]|nr:thymidine phosphorylase [Anaerolineae bacterium]